MFEWVKDFLAATGTLLSPVVIMKPWQGGIIMRYGEYRRSIASEGKRFWPLKWPLIEDYALTEICETTIRLPPQSLATKDDVQVVVSSIVKYQIRDVQKFICEVWDQKDVLADLTMGAIAKSVRDHTYEALQSGEPEKEVLTAAKRGVGKYGFEVLQVTFTDRARAKAIRLVTPNAKDLDN